MTNTLDILVKKMFTGAKSVGLSLAATMTLACCQTDNQAKITTGVSTFPIEIKDVPEEEYTCQEGVVSENEQRTKFCLYVNTGSGGRAFSRDGRIAVLGENKYGPGRNQIIEAYIVSRKLSTYVLDSVAKEVKKIEIPDITGRVTGISNDGNIFLITPEGHNSNEPAILVDIKNKVKKYVFTGSDSSFTTKYLSPDGRVISWSSSYGSKTPNELFTYSLRTDSTQNYRDSNQDHSLRQLTFVTYQNELADRDKKELFSFSQDGKSLLFFSDKDVTKEQKQKTRDTPHRGYELYQLRLNTLNAASQTRVSECQENNTFVDYIFWKDKHNLSYFCMDYERKEHTQYEFNLITRERKKIGVTHSVQMAYDTHKTESTVWIEDVHSSLEQYSWTACLPDEYEKCPSLLEPSLQAVRKEMQAREKAKKERETREEIEHRTSITEYKIVGQ